ncbi:hypothetical protein [Burkholderia sp. MSMB1835]|uniref:hypothetical protein n=1 Tax=Burkholderia sp. MSMB1835 TaxID=1637876 RepID=UPI00075988C8|nr:hypothetical protein [Burkholderia sp. MSMB1835]KVL39809.1 hypothetical protein WS96_05450 [Burkholderia sp. MSMB1835]
MKRLYARLVLWLIRPALEDVERRVVQRVEREAMSRVDADMSLRAYVDRRESKSVRTEAVRGLQVYEIPQR